MKKNILEAVGNTPIVRLNKVGAHLDAEIYAKLEYLNPGNSVKDRVAPTIVEEAEKSGRLKPGGTIVESTSGNTGAGLSMVAAVKGYKCIFVMPDKMSQEKIDRLKGYGARVIVTPTNVEPEDSRSYYSVAKRIVRRRRTRYWRTSTTIPATRKRTTSPPGRRYGGRRTGRWMFSSPEWGRAGPSPGWANSSRKKRET